MRSKRAMWARLGAPVERVLSFLTQFRSRQALKKDQENIDWMMEIIAGEDLYAVAAFDEDGDGKIAWKEFLKGAVQGIADEKTGLVIMPPLTW